MDVETREQLLARLHAAESAYHDLVTGVQPRVLVDQNGERVEYAPASAPRLALYIEELRRRLNKTTGAPMRVWLA